MIPPPPRTFRKYCAQSEKTATSPSCKQITQPSGAATPAEQRRASCASLVRRLSAFFWSIPGQDPKTAKYAVLTPGPGMFVNVQFVSRVMIAPHPKCPQFRRVSPCVPSQERKRIMMVPPGILNSFWPIFDAPKSEQEKGIGAFRANAYSQQPAVRAAARVCGFWKLTLFSRFPERFDAKFEKSRRKAPCHNGLRRRFDRKSVRFIPL